MAESESQEPTERQLHDLEGGCPPESGCSVCWPAKPADEYLEILRRICAFAFEQGYHEVGYDPVIHIEKELNQLRSELAIAQVMMAAAKVSYTMCNAVSASESP